MVRLPLRHIVAPAVTLRRVATALAWQQRDQSIDF
jgi:hypothetical protein